MIKFHNVSSRNLTGRSKVFTLSILVLVCGVANRVSAQSDSTVRARVLDEVVVTGSKTQVNRSNLPMSITVVDRESIEESSESALLPVLSQRVPGMFVSERGVTGFGVAAGGAGGITLRGIGGSPTTQVLMLIDGQPQFMGLMGHPLPDAYVASDVERVEVIRGPGSLLYGTNSMGGVINIITRRQTQPGWGFNGRIMGGSYGTQKYMGSGGINTGRFQAFVSVNHDRTDGHRENSAFDITNGFTNLGYTISDHFALKGNLSVAGYNAQNPGTIALPMQDNKMDILRGMGSVRLENNYEKLSGVLSFFYNWGDHKINDGYSAGQQPKTSRFRSKDQNYGIMLYQAYKAFTGNTVTAGVDYKSFGGHAWTRFLTGQPNAEIVDKSIYEVAGYVTDQQNFFNDRLSLTAGVRFEHNEVFGNHWVPQGGVAFRAAAATVLKASASKGFRSPTIREMYMWGAANADLKPERAHSYDLSIEQLLLDGRLNLELTGFIVKGKNLITAEGYNQLMNTGSFNNKGVEFAANWVPLRGLAVNGNYSYTHMKKPVLNAPRQMAFLSASYHRAKWGVSAGYQIVNKLFLATGNAPATESYGLLSARASYNLTRQLNIFVKGENLTDQKYQILNGYPMPGATFFAGLNFTFNK